MESLRFFKMHVHRLSAARDARMATGTFTQTAVDGRHMLFFFSLCGPLYSRELRFKGERMIQHALNKSILGRSVQANLLLTRSA